MKAETLVRVHTHTHTHHNYINQLKGKKAFVYDIKMTDIY